MLHRVGVALLVAAFMLGTGVLASQGRRMMGAHADSAGAPACVLVDTGVCLTGGGAHFAARRDQGLPTISADAH